MKIAQLVEKEQSVEEWYAGREFISNMKNDTLDKKDHNRYKMVEPEETERERVRQGRMAGSLQRKQRKQS